MTAFDPNRLDQLARRERGRLIANLVHRLGPHRLELAEDMVQEAVLAAISSWPYSGMPDKPAAWLARVAQNKAIDRLRREGREGLFEEDNDPREQTGVADNISDPRLSDPELKLIFLCCHPVLSEQDRLMLTLKIVSGFTASEIASIFLISESAAAQRLARAKRKLRLDEQQLLSGISRFEVKARLETVLKVIYLMFSAGYAPRFGDRLILKDVAFEALRLAEVIVADEETTTPEAHALVALLAFQSSRFNARMDEDGKLLLLKEQNRKLWDHKLTEKALCHMPLSQNGHALSRYHIEASIAAVHALAPTWKQTDWAAICALYNALEQVADSPVVQISYSVAEAFGGEPKAGLKRLKDIPEVEGYTPYYLAHAEIYRQLNNYMEAENMLEKARGCDASMVTADFLMGLTYS
ncbi:RNA polymerase sigma factor [Kordiimonas laminariae]|uniref:RNA polymerase sigma factor n=1 Tax=Kordiimonas laminariae TaxID=2917717 RepID=UPI001FF31AC9|nr:sigma-70 family RNA polymerase sigma factor [Kordiimonas laminariae]MCK0068168.1 sigma-70 family RNA polymerase sigma factor [Kordiimonas laminariae]